MNNKTELKERFLELVAEIKRLDRIRDNLFSAECELVFTFPDMSDRIQAERHLVNKLSGKLKLELAGIRAEFSEAERWALKREFEAKEAAYNGQ